MDHDKILLLSFIIVVVFAEFSRGPVLVSCLCPGKVIVYSLIDGNLAKTYIGNMLWIYMKWGISQQDYLTVLQYAWFECQQQQFL